MKRTALVAVLLASLATRAEAQPGEHDYRRPGDYGWFALGALSSFVLHESSHLVLDGILRTRPTFEPVRLGRIPFFAIQPSIVESDRELYAIAMMGFLAEAITNEVVLTRRPNLRYDHAPFLEGMLAFNGGLDVGYAITGFANVGPPQSDVNAMARAARIPRWATGLMLILPTAFDVVRYVAPDQKWAPWASRASRLVLFGTVFCFPRRRYAEIERPRLAPDPDVEEPVEEPAEDAPLP